MAVTRINNNQITDASAGNVYVGINAGTKLQDYSITAGKIANSLTYGSDLTITGNLTVNGQTTTIDTVSTVIEDPLIVLASNQTGSPAVDIGFIGERGTANNIAFIWDESATEFATTFTSSLVTNTTITISSYANFRTNDATVGGNLSVTGNTSFTGNITSLNVTGNITGGNLLTPGVVTATGNITGGNVSTAGQVTATGNVSGGNINLSGNIVDTGALTIITGSSGNIAFAPNGSNTAVITTTGANITGTLNATGNANVGNLDTAGQVTATGNVTGGNVITGGQVIATGNVSGANVNATSGITAGTTIVATGNVSGGNITTGGQVTATGNITGGNISTAGQITATGNVTGANLVVSTNIYDANTLNIVTGAGNLNLSPAGNIVVNNTYINGLLQPVQNQDAATKLYVDNAVTTAISYHDAVVAATVGNLNAATGGTVTYNQPNGAGNGQGATLTTTGTFNLIDTANVQTAGTRILVKDQANAVQNGVYVWSNATVITRASTEDTYGPASANALSINDYFFVSSGNVNAGSAWIVDSPAGTITFGTSNILFAQFSQSQVYTANTSAGLNLTGTVFSAKVDNNTTAFDGGGNIIVKASANLTTPNIGAATGTSLNVTGNVNGGNLTTGGQVAATGNITGGNLITAGLVSAGTTITATGNITGGNLSVGAGIISTTGNINGGNLNATTGVTSTTVIATGNVTGGNLITAGLASVTGNVTGGNIVTGGQVVATGNVNGGNVVATALVTGANVTATANVTGANVVGTTSVTGANIRISTSSIDSTAGRITINGADADVDFAVDGDIVANVFYVDAGTGTASFGTSTQTTNAIVAFNATNSVLMPVGNTQQRPSTGVVGMLRFNTVGDALEVYDSGGWTEVGTPVFTVIADEQFNGDGSTVAYTLGSTQTTASCIVSINGVVQIPTIAYSVSGTTLTFTEAPEPGDLIDVRQLTTTTTITAISNTGGNAIVQPNPLTANVDVTGNLVITGSVSAAGFIGLDATSIANGTSSVTVIASGGNIRSNVGGTTVQTISSGLVAINGDLSVTGNATLSGNILGDRIVNGTTSIEIQTPSGNANISVGGTSNVAVFTTTGLAVAGTVSVSGTGNVTGANIIATADVFTPEIIKTGSNAVGNIGQSSNYFNTVFAQATSALYADLAEKYVADAEYTAGTVLVFGGDKEVTVSSTDADRAVAGVVSTNPSYIMNAGLEAEHVATVALTGRVPCRVTGTVRKGDLMVSAGYGQARSEADPRVGTVIGKALENFEGTEGVIEVVVGRF